MKFSRKESSMKRNRPCVLFSLSILLLFLIAGLLAGCHDSESNTLSFTESDPLTQTEPLPEESQLPTEATLTPVPGHIVIGKISLQAGGKNTEMKFFSSYASSSGATIEFKEYNSDKALMEAIRAGEIDLIVDNNLIAHLLAYDDQLFNLDPYVEDTLSSGEYYVNILEAGRIHGKLQILVPGFGIDSVVQVPAGLVETFGEAKNLTDLLDLYNKLEQEYRGVRLGLGGNGIEPLLGASLNLENMQFDTSPYWDNLISLLSAIHQDSPKGNVDYTPLFTFYNSGTFEDPMAHYEEFTLDGSPYSQYGANAAYIPFSFREGEGYAIDGSSYCVPKNSPNPEAALHFINWLLTEDGQSQIEYYRLGCPLLKSMIPKWYASWRSYPEYHYTLEEQIAIGEAYAARADHLSICDGILSHTTDMLISDRCWDQEERDHIIAMYSSHAEPWAVMFDYLQSEEAPAEKMPWFYEDGTFTDWPEYVKGYVTAYLADLGYELH